MAKKSVIINCFLQLVLCSQNVCITLHKTKDMFLILAFLKSTRPKTLQPDLTTNTEFTQWERWKNKNCVVRGSKGPILFQFLFENKYYVKQD